MSNDHDDVLLAALRRLPTPEPSPDLSARFAERARRELPRRVPGWRLAIAAGLILVLGGGWWHERRAREAEVLALRNELEAAIHDVSAARRLVAMNDIGRAKVNDGATTALLIAALLTDESPSVRIAAIEALMQGADTRAFSMAVNQSLASERSSLVQSALLRSLDRLPDEDRNRILEAFLTRADIEPIVRSDARQLATS